HIWLAYTLVGMTFAGWLATVAGWYTTEIGRQPYLVYGVLTTAEAVATNVSGGMVASTLAMYLALYAVLLTAFISVVFYLARKAKADEPLPEKAFSSAAIAKTTGKEL